MAGWSRSFPLPPMTDAPQHVTTDPYLAAFLCYRGAAFLGCKRVRPKTVEFRFAADAVLHTLMRAYWAGDLTPVVPAILFAHLHRLKCLSIDRPA